MIVNQKGSVHLLILLALIGLIAYFLLVSHLPLKDLRFSSQSPDITNASLTHRNYLLATGRSQAYPGQQPLFATDTLSSVGNEADLIHHHMDNYGVPWEIFAQNSEPPMDWEWTQKMVDFAKQAGSTSKEVFLALVLTRAELAAHAKVQIDSNGQKKLLIDDEEPNRTCFDFSSALGQQRKLAYERYVNWMVRTFNPKYINIAIEVNGYWETCVNSLTPLPTAKWEAVKTVLNAAYDSAKTARADAIVFPSIVISELYGHGKAVTCGKPMTTDDCTMLRSKHYDKAYEALSGIKRDRFAVSTYPYLVEYYDPNDADGVVSFQPNTLPLDWFSRAGERGQEKTVVAETGWNSTPMHVLYNNICTQSMYFSEQEQLDYLQMLLNSAQNAKIDMINWWSIVDMLPADAMSQCTVSDPLVNQVLSDWRTIDPTTPWMGEVLLKMYSAMGFKDYNNNKKLAYNRWMEAVNTPYAIAASPFPTITPTSAVSAQTPTSTPAPIQTSSLGDGLKGEYFDDANLTNLKITRVDPQVNFNWRSRSPDLTIGVNTFSIRWSGYLKPLENGLYSIFTKTDDGVRLWINEALVIDKWTNQSVKEYRYDIDLVAGQRYKIKMEYFDNTKAASASLWWSSSTITKQPIPQSVFFSK